MGRYKTNTGGRTWTVAEDDVLLDTLLGCTTQPALLGACDRLALQFGRGNRATVGGVNGNLVLRRLWGLATTPGLYQGPQTPRISRDGPGAWGEVYAVQMAYQCSKDGATAPPADYLAQLLARPIDFVEALMVAHNPHRAMGKGFDIA